MSFPLGCRLYKKMSLRRLIVVPVVLLVLASVFFVGYFSMQNGRLAVTSVSHTLRNEITARINSRMEHFFNTPQIICGINSQLISRGILDPDEKRDMEQWFLELAYVYPQISSIYFGNPDGGLVDAGREVSDSLFYFISTIGDTAGTFQKFRIDASGNRMELLTEIPDFDARTRSWFTIATSLEGLITRTEPFIVFTGDDISISTSCAIYDQEDGFLGVISCDVFMSRLSSFLGSMQIGKTGLAFVTDSQGRILASSTSTELTNLTGPLPARNSRNELIRDVGIHIDSLYGGFSDVLSTTEYEINCNGVTSFVQISPFQDGLGRSYSIVIVIPETDFMEFIEKNRRDTAILLVISLMVALIAGVLVARLIARPIHDLRSTVRDMIKGHEKDFTSHWMTEVNELSSDFSKLTVRLNKSNDELKEEIIERKIVEKALQKSEERMDLALRGTKAATWDWNLSTGVIQINKRWAEMLAYSSDELEPVTVDKWRDLVHPNDLKETQSALQKHFDGDTEFYEASLRLKHKDGHWIWVMDRGMVLEWDTCGKPFRMAGTHVDITLRKTAEIEQQRLQNQINKTEKLESIGLLAGGVAHDLNNLLTPIIGYAEILLEDSDENTGTRPYQEILRAGKSAQQLVNQLLAFGRKQFLQLKTIDLNDVVTNHNSLLARTIRENIAISINCYRAPLPVEGDASKLEQVLVNLVVNAQDAMPHGGKMKINTALSVFPDATDKDAPAGACALLEITDNGTGMDSKTAGQIFEPFFSTKGEKGTGLGLATVYGIVRQHGGIVNVESEIGVGSTFSVFLPLSEKSISPPSEMEKLSISGGAETILVVEDSDDVRGIAVTALKRFGYTVLEASCGSDALTIIRERATAVDLMLTDVIMPGISLEELHREALALVPGLKVIYMSGYSDDNIKRNGQAGKAVPFISKPFTLSDLADKVREVL